MKLDDEIKRENPFRVPEGYFDSLADRTMEAIREEERRNGTGDGQGEGILPGTTHMQSPGAGHDAGAAVPGKPRIISMKPFLALAAAILGFAFLAAALVRLVTAADSAKGYEPGASLYADLAFEELDAYMLESELFMTEAVTEAMTGAGAETVTEAMTGAGTEAETAAMPEEEISSEAIIEYLMSEDIDLNDIYELL